MRGRAVFSRLGPEDNADNKALLVYVSIQLILSVPSILRMREKEGKFPTKPKGTSQNHSEL